MQFASLGSGSKGNATLVAAGDTVVMVDCGFGRRETEYRLQRRGLAPTDIDAILVTHEHGDHASGVAALSKAHNIPVYITHGTLASGKVDGARKVVKINAGEDFLIGDIQVRAIPVPHDAREPVQFRFFYDDMSLGILTDLGSITPHVIEAFAACTGLLLEFNHDTDLLHAGPYPAMLKRRVGGDYGHLNNRQAIEFLMATDTSRLRALVAGHISEQNNSVESARAAVTSVAKGLPCEVVYACQGEGFSWLDLSLPAIAGVAAAS
ncbi:MBL fold metallo-hydrolase [bacterium]|nr:MBL fold metallo-hydrolase [bacterium]|tara:strand:- start:532 stop:1326 length:795 start_codon:yes stop_codon:yes gene_type:complete